MNLRMTRITAATLAAVMAISPMIPMSAEAAVQSQLVSASLESTYTVTLPAHTIPLDGSTKYAQYTIGTEFDIASDKMLVVEPEESFSLADVSGGEKDSVTAYTEQARCEWKWDESGEPAAGVITAPDLTGGEWEGTLNFNVGLEVAPLEAGLFSSTGDTIATWDELVTARVFTVDGDGVLAKSTGYNNFVTSKGLGATTDCKLVVPMGVTKIADSTFNDMTILKEIVLQHGVKTVGMWVFAGCSNLTDLTIPSTVSEISLMAFFESVRDMTCCPWLTSQVVNSEFVVVGDGVLLACGFAGSNTTVDIPQGVKTIGDYALAATIYDTVTSVTVPDSVTTIGAYAFRDCTLLESIELPDSVTTIGNSAFTGCTGLTSFVIPSGVTSLAWLLFEDCSNLVEVTIPTGVTNISWAAFYSLNYNNCVFTYDGMTYNPVPDGYDALFSALDNNGVTYECIFDYLPE